MLREYIPVQRNPMQLVKVKGSTKRQRKLVVLTPDEFKTYVQSLPEPYNLMVLVSGCFGFRVSETLDFDFGEDTVQVRRVFRHGRIQELPKTDASADPLPIHPKLMAVLKQWRKRQDQDESWVFPSPRTGGPYSDSTILTDYLKPAAAMLGVKWLGWHTFRRGVLPVTLGAPWILLSLTWPEKRTWQWLSKPFAPTLALEYSSTAPESERTQIWQMLTLIGLKK